MNLSINYNLDQEDINNLINYKAGRSSKNIKNNYFTLFIFIFILFFVGITVYSDLLSFFYYSNIYLFLNFLPVLILLVSAGIYFYNTRIRSKKTILKHYKDIFNGKPSKLLARKLIISKDKLTAYYGDLKLDIDYFNIDNISSFNKYYIINFNSDSKYLISTVFGGYLDSLIIPKNLLDDELLDYVSNLISNSYYKDNLSDEEKSFLRDDYAKSYANLHLEDKTLSRPRKIFFYLAILVFLTGVWNLFNGLIPVFVFYTFITSVTLIISSKKFVFSMYKRAYTSIFTVNNLFKFFTKNKIKLSKEFYINDYNSFILSIPYKYIKNLEFYENKIIVRFISGGNIIDKKIYSEKEIDDITTILKYNTK